MALKIAVTGGFAAGKTTVTNIIKNKVPCSVIFNADKIANVILQTTATEQVNKQFGTNSKKKLRDIVFSNKIQLKKLENIIHPLVDIELEKFFNNNKNKKLLIAEIPILFNGKRENLFDRIITVENSDIENSYKRVKFRTDGNINRNTFNNIINSQDLPINRIKKATDVIFNDKNLIELNNNISDIIKKLNL
jgi:dephospho-CoA kinase